jgi:hypothetical protein
MTAEGTEGHILVFIEKDTYLFFYPYIWTELKGRLMN